MFFLFFFFGRRHFKNEQVLISTNQSNCSADCVIDDSFFCHLLSRQCYRQNTGTCRFPTTVFQIGTLLNQSVNVMPQTRHVLEIRMLCVLIKEVSSCNYCSLQPHDCMCSTSFAKWILKANTSVAFVLPNPIRNRIRRFSGSVSAETSLIRTWWTLSPAHLGVL